MNKILLATAAGASLLAATLTTLPAHADELPTTGSTAPAQKAPQFKVDFNWTIPENPAGAPYDKCNVQLIRADGTVANEAPFPASLPTVTYKLDAGESHDENFTPGLSTVSLAYTCVNADGDVSAVQHIDSVVVPDVVPTAPAYVSVDDPDALYPTVSFGGSQTLGLAKLEGYSVDVLSGSSLVSSNYTPVSNSAVRGSSRMRAAAVSASNDLSTTLANLPTGLYSVRVKGKNAVGLSEYTSTEVMIYAKPSGTTTAPVLTPSKVRSIKAKVTKSSATITWAAPANKMAVKYSVKVYDNAGKGKTYAVGAKTILKVKGLKKNAGYQVRISAIGAAPQQLTSLTAAHFKTSKR